MNKIIRNIIDLWFLYASSALKDYIVAIMDSNFTTIRFKVRNFITDINMKWIELKKLWDRRTWLGEDMLHRLVRYHQIHHMYISQYFNSKKILNYETINSFCNDD